MRYALPAAHAFPNPGTSTSVVFIQFGKKVDMSSVNQKCNCPLCHCFAAPTVKAVVRHIGAVHGNKHGFYVCCGVQGCPRTYHNFHSYKNHMYKKHRDVLDDVGSTSTLPLQSNCGSTDNRISVIADGMYGEEYVVDSGMEVDQRLQLSDDETEKRQSALFLMKAKEINKVSQSALNELVGDITSLFEQKVQSLQSSVSAALAEKGIIMDPELQSLFCKPEVIAPFQGLESEYLQKKFYRENFGLLVC